MLPPKHRLQQVAHRLSLANLPSRWWPALSAAYIFPGPNQLQARVSCVTAAMSTVYVIPGVN